MVEIETSLKEKIIRFASFLEKQFSLVHVYLYGSYSTGTNDQWSDVDLAVILDEPESHSREIFTLGKRFDQDFEVFAFTKKDFDESRLPIIPQIKKGIVIV